MGYCGLDRTRQPISGDEIRACWESRPEAIDVALSPPPPLTFDRTPVPHREFIEVIDAVPTASTRRARHAPESPALDPDIAPAVTGPRWSLWEDAEV